MFCVGLLLMGQLLGDSVFTMSWEWSLTDQLMRWLVPSEPVAEITLIAIDEKDLAMLKQWPMSDRQLAEVMDRLVWMGARTIGLNLYRQTKGDVTRFEALWESYPQIFGIEKVLPPKVQDGEPSMPPDRLGFTDVVLDRDRLMRRALLTVNDLDGKEQTALGVKLALHYLQQEGIKLETVNQEKRWFRLGKQVFRPLLPGAMNYPPEELGGYQILLNWRGRSSQFRTFHLRQLLDNQIPESAIRDRLVLLGSSVDGLQAGINTPLSQGWWGNQPGMNGTLVHANVAYQLIGSAQGHWPLLQGWHRQWLGLFLLPWCMVGTLGIWWLETHPRRSSWWQGAGLLILCQVLWWLGAYGLARWEHQLVPIALPPLMGWLGFLNTNSRLKRWHLNHVNQQLAIANQRLENYSHNLEDTINERTQSLQEEIRHKIQAQTKLKHLLKQLADFKYALDQGTIVIMTDPKGHVLYVNEAFCELSQYSWEEIRGQNTNVLTSNYHVPAFFQALWDTIDRGEVWRGEICSRAKDGSLYWVDTTIVPFLDTNGDIYQHMAIQNNITDRKQAELDLKKAKEQAEQASRTKSQFLAHMSHELRTPLNAILGFTQMLESDPQAQDHQKQYLATIHRSGDHLLELINDVLELSKIEAGRQTLEPRDFDLHRLIENLQEMFRLRSQGKGIALTWQQDHDLPQWIYADEKKLRQVLINLLGNALKFTNSGQVVLSATLLEAQDNQLTLGFVVQDTGIGIPMEEMEAIFEPFGQGKSGRHNAQGTGLGLPISREFIRLMGGDLICHSQVGQGSSFSFSIACERVQGDIQDSWRPAGSEPRVVGLAEDQRDFRILVVDDQLASRQLLLDLLAPLGFHVQTAANGREAVAQWHQWQPHLIWMDLAMPEMDGVTAIRLIREAWTLDPRKVQSKIVILTAQGCYEDRQSFLDLGSDDVLFKPCAPQVILNKLVEHLGVRYLMDQMTQASPEILDAIPMVWSSQAIAAGLRQLPQPWQEAFAEAVHMGDGEQCECLLQELEEGTLRTAIRQKIEEFDFFALVEIVETFAEGGSPIALPDGDEVSALGGEATPETVTSTS